MDLGMQIAVDVLTIYGCLGPFVFLGLYVLFDRFAERDVPTPRQSPSKESDPALWSEEDVRNHLAEKNFLQGVTSRR